LRGNTAICNERTKTKTPEAVSISNKNVEPQLLAVIQDYVEPHTSTLNSKDGYKVQYNIDITDETLGTKINLEGDIVSLTNIGLLQRDYKALHPRRLSPS
jgi:hypothetical protein